MVPHNRAEDKVMVGGFNTNIRYCGRTFHVQTEDQGELNPQIVTLLYEGGAIISVSKRSYEDVLSRKDLESVVRTLMEDQHRSVVQNLKSGALDEAVGVSSSTGTEGAARSEASSAPEFGEGIISDVPLAKVIRAHLAGR
ncbi:MAG: hypothetical protein O7B23_07100 [Deltaproteobacteria bacterium]|nr:hypothetical protein [Deltaproteobacteria bacterium]